MSDTLETDDIARGNHVVSTEWAKQLERERDEAREALKHIEEYGTDEINAAVELRQKLATALLERDEWAAMCGTYKQERDKARDALAKILKNE